MKNMKIVVTGGHHNSALVVAKDLSKLGHQVSWFGHRHAGAGDTNDSAEYLEVTSAKLPFYDLPAGKLTLKKITRIPQGLFYAYGLLSQIKPDAVLSFGSYLGLTVSLAAAVKNIPIFIHEQTVIAGKANKLSARFAKRIYLTWASSVKYFPRAKCLMTGLPLRSSIVAPAPARLFGNQRPTLIVMGGKQGSHILNSLVFSHLPELLQTYNLIHQTGTSSVTQDYQKAIALKDSLPPQLNDSYRPEGYLGEAEIGTLLANCDLYLGRSGAHITYELGIMAKKCVLIPFMHTHSREQLKNARLLESSGIAQILPQSSLSFTSLKHAIETGLARPQPAPLPLPLNAARIIVQDLIKHAAAH